jgi:aspartate racemase
MTANTPHVVFDEIARRSPIPLVSIVEAACAEAKRRNLRKLGLVGSRMTMEARFFPEVFARAGLAVVAPNAADQKLIHEKYINELVPGKFFPETRDALLAAIGRLSAEQGIDAVLLAGTELPLLLKDESHGGVPLLDTTKIHVVEIVDEMVANPHSSQSRA